MRLLHVRQDVRWVIARNSLTAEPKLETNIAEFKRRETDGDDDFTNWTVGDW
jgi:hypothetical protein